MSSSCVRVELEISQQKEADIMSLQRGSCPITREVTVNDSN